MAGWPPAARASGAVGMKLCCHRPRRRWPLPDLVLLAIELAVLLVWLAIVLLAT